MTPIRLLLVGAGAMGRTHIGKVHGHDGAELRGIVEPNGANVDAIGELQDAVAAHDSVTAALATGAYDAAINATPDHLHHPTTMQLLSGGLHVLCEKPLATTVAEAEELVRAARIASVVNMVNFTYRGNWAAQEAQRLISDGAIGAVRHFSASYLQSWLTQDAWGDWRSEPRWLWRLSSDHGSLGVLGDVGVHLFDLVCFVLGGDVRSLSCNLTTFEKASGDRIGEYALDANDSCVAHLATESGATGVFHCSRFASGHLNDVTIEVHGTKGALRLETTGKVHHLSRCAGSDLKAAAWQPVAERKAPDILEMFLEAIRHRRPQHPDFADGARAQRLIEAAFRASKDGRQVALLPDRSIAE